MLQQISDRLKGWVAGVIIVIIAAVFVLWGVEYYVSRGNDRGSEAVVKVNGKPITEKTLNRFTRQLQQRVQSAQPNKPLSLEEQKQIRQLALQQLISKTALLQAAEKQGFDVSQEQIQQLILQAPEFQVNGRFSPQRFQQFLFAIQLTENQFLGEVRGNYIINQVASGIENSAFVLPNELNHAYELIYQKRNFGYFTLPLSKFLKNIQLTDQEIQTYYNQNKEAYKVPKKIQLSYLLLSPKDIEKTINLSPSDLKKYYEANTPAFTVPKQWKIRRIIIPVSATATAKELAQAKKSLEKIKSELKGGETLKSIKTNKKITSTTTIYTLQNTPTEIANILDMLKSGHVSEPFRTDQGVNLIKVISISPKKIKSFNEVKNEIEQRMRRQRVQQIFSQKSEALSNLTYTNPDTLEIAAKKLNLNILTSPWLTEKRGSKEGIFSNHIVIVAAFSANVLQDKNNSDLINLPDGSVLVMRLNQYLPSRVQTLAEVTETIKNVLKKNKAESKAGLEAYQISSALGKGVSPQVLAKRYAIQWTSKKNVDRNDKTIAAPILASVFSTRPEDSQSDTGVNTLVLANGDYVVLKVTSAILANPVTAPTDRLDKLQQQLMQLKGSLDYRLYSKSIMDNTKVKRQQQ